MAAQQHVHHFRAHTCQELCDTPIADTETSVTTFVDLVALIDRTLDALERGFSSAPRFFPVVRRVLKPQLSDSGSPNKLISAFSMSASVNRRSA
jgi:hypothetical protein